MEKIYIGTAYYPEHWPKERWHEDVCLMREAGINVVRIAELAWGFLEPEDGVFDFSWLDEFIGLASQNRIAVVLGTPTEVTPTWMNRNYPEIIAVNREGHTQGGRGNHCYNSKVLNCYAERIARKMAEHYKDHPAVIGWQLDNEIRGTKCYCRQCREKFREYLKEEYQTLDELNRQWGTCFWSQTYRNWEEVELPSQDQYTVSTSQILDHFRFASHSAVQFLKRQADIIRTITRRQFLSHNSLGLCEWVNLFEMGKYLDYMGLDSYPYVDDDHYAINMAHDLARGTRHDHYWIWEQKNGYVNYHTCNLAIEPGLVSLWTWQDLAHGANGVVYYRWRSNRYSYEQNPNGILRHDGSKRGVYQEIVDLNRKLQVFSDRLAGTTVEADAALLYSYDQMWDEHSNRQYKNLSYRQMLLSCYKELTALGMTADLVDPCSDLSGYKLVAAPGLAVMDESMTENLNAYVKGGGFLILSVRSGIKTWAGSMTDQKWPGRLSGLAGLNVDEFEMLPEDRNQGIVYNGKEYAAGGWLERLTCRTARPIAAYTTSFYRGDTAVAVHTYGAGKVLYIGAMKCPELIHDLLARAAGEVGIRTVELPQGVFLTRRSGQEGRFIFLINHNRLPVKVRAFLQGRDLMTGKETEEEMEIPARDLYLIEQKIEQNNEKFWNAMGGSEEEKSERS